MSNSNQNNRPDVIVPLGDIAANGNITVFYAHKSVLLKNASLFSEQAMSGTAGQLLEFKMRMRTAAGDASDVTVEVNTQANTGNRVLNLNVPDEFEVPQGATLAVNIAETGNDTWTGVNFALDYQVKGN